MALLSTASQLTFRFSYVNFFINSFSWWFNTGTWGEATEGIVAEKGLPINRGTNLRGEDGLIK